MGGFAALGAGFFGAANTNAQFNRDQEAKWIDRYDQQLQSARKLLTERQEKLSDLQSQEEAYTTLLGDPNKARVAAYSGLKPDEIIHMQMVGALGNGSDGSGAQPVSQPQAGQASSVQPTVAGAATITGAPQPGQAGAQPTAQTQPGQNPTQPDPRVAAATVQASQQPQQQPSQLAPYDLTEPGIPAPDTPEPTLLQRIGSALTGRHTPDQILGRAQALEEQSTGLSPDQQRALLAGKLPERPALDTSQHYQLKPDNMDLRKTLLEAIAKGESTDPGAAQASLEKGDIAGAMQYFPSFQQRMDATARIYHSRVEKALDDTIREMAPLAAKKNLTPEEDRQLKVLQKKFELYKEIKSASSIWGNMGGQNDMSLNHLTGQGPGASAPANHAATTPFMPNSDFPRDPSKREIGKVYTVNGNSMKWDGTHLIANAAQAPNPLLQSPTQ